MFSDEELDKIFGESSEPSLSIGGSNVKEFKEALDSVKDTKETPTDGEIYGKAGMAGIKSGVSTGLATGNPYAGIGMGALAAGEALYSGDQEAEAAEEAELQRKEMQRLKAKNLALDEYKKAFS